MLRAGTAAGVLSALAVAGDPPGVVVALVVAAGLATGWPRDLTVRCAVGVAVLTAIASLAGVLGALGVLRGSDGRATTATATATVAATVAAVLAVVPAISVVVALPAAALAVSAARLSSLGVRADRADLERAGGVSLVVTGDGALTRPAGVPAQVWAVDGDVAGLAQALVLCVADPPVAADAAVFALARSLGLDPGQVIADHPRVAEVPFDADRRRMTTASRTVEGYLVVCQGAPEALWPLVVTSADGASRVTALAEPLVRRWTSDGLRVTAVATTTRRVAGNTAGRLEWGLRLHGLVGYADPPLAGVREAVADLADLGVGVAVVTGDHRATALATASRAGIVPGVRGSPVATGEEVAAGRWAHDIRVYARTGPEQRARLVARWRDGGEVVAVTGHDAVDLPAMRRADVAIALGAGAEEVVRRQAGVHTSTADLTLVVALIREARRVRDVVHRGSAVIAAVVVAATGVVVAGAVSGVVIAGTGAGPGLTPAQVLLLTILVAVPVLAHAREPLTRSAAGSPRRGAGRGSWWRRVLAVGAVLLLVAVTVAWWATASGRPLPATVFASLSAAVLGLVAAGRAGLPRGAGTRGVTGAVVAAGLGLVLVLLPPLSWLMGGESIGPGGALAVVAAAAAGYTGGRLLRR